MFDRLRDALEKSAQEKQLKKQAELERLASLSEKEILLEILFELKRLNDKVDDMERNAVIRNFDI